MSLRRVEAREAGPAALGILLPPGPHTVLLLRPRSLPWDLLLVRGGEGGEPGTPFLHLDPEEGHMMAEGLLRALERWAGGGAGKVEAAFAADGAGYWVQADVGAFPLLACERRPGQPYRPAAFATAEEAGRAAAAVVAALCPQGSVGVEVYLNTRHFGQ
ncbi:MAG TPA: hypothetical protein VFW33_05015 [Gemmataceae bacterium]|nr:hypothetical protein [Gemmataceae bacterium]